MNVPTYPNSDAEAAAYAKAIGEIHDESWIAIRLPEECTARHGLKFAAVRKDELPSYLEMGATTIL